MEQHRGHFGQPSNPHDYSPALYRSATASQRGQSPALILSKYGMTIYGTGTSRESIGVKSVILGKEFPQNDSYILYQSIKK